MKSGITQAYDQKRDFLNKYSQEEHIKFTSIIKARSIKNELLVKELYQKLTEQEKAKFKIYPSDYKVFLENGKARQQRLEESARKVQELDNKIESLNKKKENLINQHAKNTASNAKTFLINGPVKQPTNNPVKCIQNTQAPVKKVGSVSKNTPSNPNRVFG